MSGKVEINKRSVPHSARTCVSQTILPLSPHLCRMFHKGGLCFPNQNVAVENTGVQNSQKTKKYSDGP